MTNEKQIDDYLDDGYDRKMDDKQTEQGEFNRVQELIAKYLERVMPYVKLTKNTKGYNWEIKILSNDISELEKINYELLTKFGGE